MAETKKIAVIAGDGIGPEVVAEAEKIEFLNINDLALAVKTAFVRFSSSRSMAEKRTVTASTTSMPGRVTRLS